MQHCSSKAVFVNWPLLVVTFLCICCWDSAGQQAPALPTLDTADQIEPASAGTAPESGSPAAAPGEQAKENEKSKKQNQNQGTSNDRLFYALPNFLTLENAANVPPLTTGQKFKVVARSSFDYVEYFWYGALAGIGQAENSEARYGQGAEGYGKRYGTAFADGTIENFMTGAILPSLLHQDPRYFQSGKGGFWHRTGYAISRIFVTRTDSGRNQFNYSEIFGSAASAGISTFTYHPRGDRNLESALSVWGTEVGYDTLTIVIKEFWPDLRRKLRKTKEDKTTP